MQERRFTVENELGLHARPAAMLVKTTHKYPCGVTIIKDDQTVDGKSIMGILTLAAERGSSLRVIADGEGEGELLAELETLFKAKFEE